MPSNLKIQDNLSPQPKMHVIVEAWKLNIGPMIIRIEAHEIQTIIIKLYWMFCFQFERSKLGQLKGQED
jgi:hypothetical protein